MDIKKTLHKIGELIKKNRYIAVVLLIGITLMCIPTSKKEGDTEKQIIATESEISIEDRLGQILTQVDGAGEVQVFLTVASGEQTIYQTNDTLSYNDNSSNSQVDTVIITDSKRSESGLIRQTNPPQYQGAIVVCSGADSPAVKLAIVDAVSKVTGLGSDKISVLKMK